MAIRPARPATTTTATAAKTATATRRGWSDYEMPPVISGGGNCCVCNFVYSSLLHNSRNQPYNNEVEQKVQKRKREKESNNTSIPFFPKCHITSVQKSRFYGHRWTIQHRMGTFREKKKRSSSSQLCKNLLLPSPVHLLNFWEKRCSH